MIKCNVSNTAITIAESERLTAGRVGLECQFTFSSEWDGLAKVAYFLGSTTSGVVITEDTVTVPAGPLAEAGYKFYVGVVGKNAAGDVVIPTLWAKVGKIQRSAAEGDESQPEPDPDVVAQIQLMAMDAVEKATYAKGVIDDNLEAITEAGETQTAAIQAESATQQEAIAEAAAAARASIPEDYTTLSDNVSNLKSAFGPALDGCFVDVANDKFGHGNYGGVQYSIIGNTVEFNGTGTANVRFKMSGAAFDRNTSVQAAWREEQIGLIEGHEYVMCAEIISGTGWANFVIYTAAGTGESISVDSSVVAAHEFVYGNKFTASSDNARCLTAYSRKNAVYSDFVVRFSFLDVTKAKELLWDKVGLHDASVDGIIQLMQNRNAASGMVDFNVTNGSVTYGDLTVTAQGNRFVLNGSASANVRVKITNGLAATNGVPSNWLEESLPVLDSTHDYIIAVSKLSGSVDANRLVRVGCYDKTGAGGDQVAYIVTENGFSTGVSYSGVITNAEDLACLILYFPSGASVTNVVVQVDLIDVTVLKSLLEITETAKQPLHDYYFDNDYIGGRLNDIIELRAGASIHNASFLWFTDPHYYRPAGGTVENGFQSVEIASYLKNTLNNRMVICGGDLLRGTISKALCRENLIKTREYMDKIYDDLYMCLGNHEYNNPGDTTSQEVNELHSPELYEMLCKNQELVFDSMSSKADYTFRNAAQKTKFYVLGCDNSASLFPESITWLADEMTRVEDGYHVIIVSHIGLTYGNDGTDQINSKFYEVRDIIDAVNGRGTYSYNGTEYSYASLNCEVVCALTGHVHYDGNALTPGGTPVISTTCDRAFLGSDGDECIREVRKIGTIGEQALDYVLIDFDAHTIDLIRLGGSTNGASYDAETGKVYDTEVGTGTEFTGAEWVEYSPYKDRHFSYTGHLTTT